MKKRSVILFLSTVLVTGGIVVATSAFAAPEASNRPHRRYVLMVAGDSSGPPTPTPTIPPATATPTRTPTALPSPTPIPAPLTFGPGTFLVGSDIAARTYRTRSVPDGCYWERLRGLTGDFDEIIANDFTDGVSVVSIHSSDVAFKSSNCGVWTTDLSPITVSATAALQIEGTFIVGVDIAPGLWRAPGGSGCYWKRLAGFSGEFDDIIDNDFSTGGQVLVQILGGDKGFNHHGCGTWTR